MNEWPNVFELNPPVIVVGMHRSGTSLLSRLLQSMGVHMGADKTVTYESKVFRSLNQQMLHNSSATWFNPEPMWATLENPESVASEALKLEVQCTTNLRNNYWGTEGCAKKLWGWKDPRTTIVLPIWLRLFQDARIVHIVRNGADVADSLLRRSRRKHAKRSYINQFVRHTLLRRPENGLPSNERFSFSSLSQGFELWERYLEFEDHATQPLRTDRLLTVRFEDLALRPAKELNRLAAFIESPQPAQLLGELAKLVDGEKAWKFHHSEETMRFATHRAQTPMMQRYMYSDQISGG